MKLGLHLVINVKQAVVQGLQQVHLCNGRQTSYIANIMVQNPEGCLTLNINNTKNYIFIRSWCLKTYQMVPGAGIEPARPEGERF